MIQEPKHNKGYELQIIGALLTDCQKQEVREALDLLSGNDFYVSTHRNIFNQIKEMVEAKVSVNCTTVETWMNERNIDCVGWYFLADQQKSFISMNAVEGYVKELKRCSLLRDLQLLTSNVNTMLGDNYDPDEIINFVEGGIKDATANVTGRDLQHIKYACGDWLDLLQRREKVGGGILGVSTGFPQLDESLGGFDEESLIVVAGAPSMGKTLFTQSLSINVGVDQRNDVMFFSMEMSANQLYERFVSGLSTLAPGKLRLARFNNEENGRISTAVNQLGDSGIHFTDEQGLSVAQIRAKVRRHKIKNPNLKMIVIDYLGLMKLGKADRHDIAIGNVTRSLKELAKEIKTPIVLIAQANRTSARPNMRSLKDSSCIEADADVIMFVHRHEILEPDTELKGITELIIAKDRHNDGNGTIYMQKINGGFKEMSTEEAAIMVHNEEMRLNPIKPKKEDKQQRGYSKGK
tara:strand:+ start:5752 stop:7143 length:1392 start_codon:yes stop_codon:yes gene_type:complete